ncbi:hypothetical protein [Nostoc sp. 2RC]|uniref:hypothetical protein n=1 Tax=Nostoc sp. 2RC TaxID=2485484 RepID=UPI0016294F08|nr:hypothetical protein [Nostoc sp. 2RC]MBC1239148.1 hypothetical protein [Nostoc sp. 2RC]
MTFQNLQKQALQLSTSERWQLVQTLLESLQQETRPLKNKGNLSRLRGIAKGSDASGNEDIAAEYITYLTEKYQ